MDRKKSSSTVSENIQNFIFFKGQLNSFAELHKNYIDPILL